MKIILAAIILAISVGSTRASLGDTEQQLVSRYGPKLGAKTSDQALGGAVAADRVSFMKAGLQYDVLLFKGVSSEESVYHRPYAPLTEAEVKALLDANAQGQSWKSVVVTASTGWLRPILIWERSDGSTATVEEPEGKPRLLFHVKSKALIDAEKATQAQAK
jgi:hypothetical protein